MEVAPYIFVTLHYMYFNDDQQRNKIIPVLKNKMELIIQAIANYQDNFRMEYESKENGKNLKSRNSIKLEFPLEEIMEKEIIVKEPKFHSIEIPNQEEEKVIFEIPKAPKGGNKTKTLFLSEQAESEQQQADKPNHKQQFSFPNKEKSSKIEIPTIEHKEPTAPKGQKPKFLFPGEFESANKESTEDNSKKTIENEIEEIFIPQLELPNSKPKKSKPKGLELDIDDINELYTFGGEGGGEIPKIDFYTWTLESTMKSREKQKPQILPPQVPATMRGNKKIEFESKLGKKKPNLELTSIETSSNENSNEKAKPQVPQPPRQSKNTTPNSLKNNSPFNAIQSQNFDSVEEMASRQVFELSIGSSQFLDGDSVHRKLYNAILVWIFGVYDYGLKENFVVEEEHKIVNKSGLILLKELLNGNLNSTLKLKIVQDVYLLIKWSVKNAMDIIEEDFILVWILSEIEALKTQNNKPHLEIYIKTLGNLFKVALERLERGYELIIKCFNYLRQPLFDFNIEILGMLISGAIHPILQDFPENSDILTKNLISLFKCFPQALILNGLEGLKSRVFGIPESQGRAKLENINSYVVFFSIVEHILFEKSLLCKLTQTLSPKTSSFQEPIDYKIVLKSLFSTSIFLLLMSWKAEKKEFVHCVHKFCLRVLDYVFNDAKIEDSVDPNILKLIDCYFEAMHFCEGSIDLANSFRLILNNFPQISSKLSWNVNHSNLESLFIDMKLIKYINVGQDMRALRLTFSSKNLEGKLETSYFNQEEFNESLNRIKTSSKRYFIEIQSYLKKNWKKVWRNLRIYDSTWGHPEMFLQENQHFVPKPYDPDENRPFKLKLWNYQFKGRIRPLLKMIPNDLTDFEEFEMGSKSLGDIKLHRQYSEKKMPMILEKALNIIKNPFKKIINAATGKKSVVIERCTSFVVQKIKTLTIVEGKLEILEDFINFKAFENSRDYTHICLLKFQMNSQNIHQRKYRLANIREVISRRFLMKRSGAEIFFSNGKSIFLNFSLDTIESFFEEMKYLKKSKFPNIVITKFIDQVKGLDKNEICEKWIEGKVSNLEYLMFVNSLGSRTIHDLSQYFVVPWIFSELNNLETRDLSKTLGALSKNSSRLSEMKEKFSCTSPPYHYGSHYTCPSIVLHFLMRIRPYAEGGIALQSGKFDIADRLLYSIAEACNSAFNEPRDYRELIPEYYYLPEMFINLEGFNYGTLSSGKRVHHVILPLWAGANPYIFVAKMRKHFEESNFVSSELSSWIDLFFGFKQTDKFADDNFNTFYPLTYEENYVEPEPDDKEMIAILETQISGFGQVPVKILKQPHKKRMKFKFSTVLDAKYSPKVFRPVSRSNVVKEIKENIFDNPESSCIYSKFVSDNKILSIRKNGMIQILQWQMNSLSSTHNKLPFTLLLEKEIIVNFPESKIFNNLINYKVPPIISINSGKILLIGGYFDGSVKVEFILGDKKKEYFINHHCSTVSVLKTDANENYLIMGSIDGEISFWKCLQEYTFKYLRSIFGRPSIMQSIDIHSDMPLVAISYENGKIDVFNFYDGEFIRSFKNPRGDLPILRAYLFSSPLPGIVFYDGEYVFSYSINGQFLSKLMLRGVSCMEVYKDWNHLDILIISLNTFEIKVFETPFLNIVNTIKTYTLSTSLLISKDLKFMICGTIDGDLAVLWDSSI